MSSARVLVVDDESDIRELLQEILSEEGYEVTTAADAAQARSARRSQSFDLTLLDIWMPDTDGISLLKEWAGSGALEPVVMMSGHGTVDTAVEATRLGALDFIEKPVSLAKLLRTVEKALEGRRTKDLRRGLLPPTLAPVGKSEKIRAVREQVERVAGHDADTLFSGEPGSGRELFARYLASRSKRANKPFIVVAGADLTESDTRRLLIGQGTGALERANGGTLFISELGDIPAAAHQQLLTILGRNRADPAVAAGSSPREYDVRILASASRGYERGEASQQNPLFSHLSMVVISVPPLREYPEDVPELLRYYVDVLVDTESLPFRRFSVAAQNRLRNYPWPGNVRELRNVVKRLLILGGAEEISLQEAEAQLASSRLENEPLVKQDLLAMPLREAREHFERAYLQQQLLLCGGKVGRLAKRVGMERTHLYRKLRSLGVDFRQPLSEE